MAMRSAVRGIRFFGESTTVPESPVISYWIQLNQKQFELAEYVIVCVLQAASNKKKFTIQVAMKPALISGFCSVERMRVFGSPWTEH